jgi:hypothetical protein
MKSFIKNIFSFFIVLTLLSAWSTKIFAYSDLGECLGVGNNYEDCCKDETLKNSSECTTPPSSGTSQSLENRPETNNNRTASPSSGTNAFCNSQDFIYENGLCVPKSKYSSESLAGSSSLMDLISKILKFLLTFAGVVSVLSMVYGGYLYIVAAGNDETAEKGKKVLINSTIGLIVIILAYTIVTILVATITKTTI